MRHATTFKALLIGTLLAGPAAAQTPPPPTSPAAQPAGSPTGAQEKPKSLPAKGSNKETTTKSSEKAADATFVRKAAEGGLAEVELGRLAADKASTADVKDFGNRMVSDHTRANEELSTLATQKGWNIPKEPGTKQQADLKRLQGLSGAAFDRAYMRHMVQDHQEDVSLFEHEGSSAQDADLKAWAQKTLPTLREHLQMARTVSGTLGESTGTSGKKSGTPKNPGAASPQAH